MAEARFRSDSNWELNWRPAGYTRVCGIRKDNLLAHRASTIQGKIAPVNSSFHNQNNSHCNHILQLTNTNTTPNHDTNQTNRTLFTRIGKRFWQKHGEQIKKAASPKAYPANTSHPKLHYVQCIATISHLLVELLLRINGPWLTWGSINYGLQFGNALSWKGASPCY